MENLNTVTLNTNTLAAQIAALSAYATQKQIEAVVMDQSITTIVGIDPAGQKIVGSAERAMAALINYRLFDAMCAEESYKHWSKVEHRETSDLAKALAPMKAEFFTAHKGHSNPSTKWARIRVMAYDLIYTKIDAPIGEGEEGEGDEGAGNTSRTRDLYSRYVIELAKLYRAGMSAENDAVIKAHAFGEEITAALEAITTALQALNAPLEDEDLKAFMKSMK